MAYPNTAQKPDKMWVVVLKDEGFASCEPCVLELEERIASEFGDVVRRVRYVPADRTFRIWVPYGRSLDTLRLSRLLREEGVKDYEILH